MSGTGAAEIPDGVIVQPAVASAPAPPAPVPANGYSKSRVKLAGLACVLSATCAVAWILRDDPAALGAALLVFREIGGKFLEIQGAHDTAKISSDLDKAKLAAGQGAA